MPESDRYLRIASRTLAENKRLVEALADVLARRLKGRNDKQREFGGQLDSLIDVVSFSICPAITLLSYGHFSPWFLPGAFIIIVPPGCFASAISMFLAWLGSRPIWGWR